MEYTVTTADFSEVIFGATGAVSIIQNVKTIMRTLVESVPLDRGFGRVGEMIDKPSPKAMALEVSALYDAITELEPRVELTDIRFVDAPADALEGRLIPQIKFKIKDGVL